MSILKGYAKRCFEELGYLPSYAFPGGYPLAWYTGENATLCGDCATEEIKDYYKHGAEPGYVWYDGELAEDASVLEEGAPVYCDSCNGVIFEGYEECVICHDYDETPAMAWSETLSGMVHADCLT